MALLKSSHPYKWQDADSKLFLEHYRKYECLWNPESDTYRSKLVRNMAYESLKQDMSIEGWTVDDIKNKIKNFRTVYGVELKKVTKSMGVYEPRLSWFKQADAFLRQVTDRKKNVVKKTKIKEEEADDEHSEASTPPSPGPSTSSAKRPRLNTELDSAPIALTQNAEDEFDLFGKTIALQLKQMPLDIAIRLQERIQYAVNKERLKLFKDFCLHNLMSPEMSPSEMKAPLYRQLSSPSDEAKITSSGSQQASATRSLQDDPLSDTIVTKPLIKQEPAEENPSDGLRVFQEFERQKTFVVKQEFPDEFIEFTDTQLM